MTGAATSSKDGSMDTISLTFSTNQMISLAFRTHFASKFVGALHSRFCKSRKKSIIFNNMNFFSQLPKQYLNYGKLFRLVTFIKRKILSV